MWLLKRDGWFQVDEQVKAELVNVIHTKYGGISDTEAASLAFNALMLEVNHCARFLYYIVQICKS